MAWQVNAAELEPRVRPAWESEEPPVDLGAADRKEQKRRPWFHPPLFVDLSHDATRSRVFLMLLFALATSIVCFYFIVYSLNLRDGREVRMSFAATPPVSIDVGAVFAPFSVILTNHFGVGIRGARVSIRMHPLLRFTFSGSVRPLVVTGSQDSGGTAMETVAGRTLDCVSFLLFPAASLFPEEDRAFCDPFAAGLLAGATAVTDESGTAVFDSLRLRLGLGVTYRLLVTHEQPQTAGDPNPSFLDASVVVSSTVVAIHAVANASTVVPRSVRLREPFSIEASIVFAVRPAVDAALAKAQSSDLLRSVFGAGGATSSSLTGPKSAGEAPNATALEIRAMLLAFQPAATAGRAGKPGLLSPMLARITDAVLSADGLSLTASVRFSRVSFLLAASPEPQYIGVFVGGTAVLLLGGGGLPAPSAAASEAMRPPSLLQSIEVTSDVARIVLVDVLSGPSAASLSATSALAGRVVDLREGHTLRISVRVLDTAGTPVGSARVMMSATPRGALGFEEEAKRLSVSLSAASDAASGTALFDAVQFSAGGRTGLYDVALCVLNVCAAAPPTAAGGSLEPIAPSSLLVNVTSAVAAAVSEVTLPWIPTAANGTVNVTTQQTPNVLSALPIEEVVGVAWASPPTVRITDTTTGRPLGGKRAVLRPFVSGSVIVKAQSGRSSFGDGTLAFDSIVVLAAAAEGLHTFQVLVDGKVVGNITRVLRWPVAAVLPQTPFRCAAVVWPANVADEHRSGRATLTTVSTAPLLALASVKMVDERLQPVPLAQVALSLLDVVDDGGIAGSGFNAARLVAASTAGRPLAAGNNAGGGRITGNVVADINGVVSFQPFAIASVGDGVTVVGMAVQCNSVVLEPTLVATVIPRVRRIIAPSGTTAVSVASGVSATRVFSVNVSVDSEFPAGASALFASLRLVQQPAFFADYYASSATGNSGNSDNASVVTAVSVGEVSPVDGSVLLTATFAAAASGRFAFAVFCDGVVSANVLTAVVAPLVGSITLSVDVERDPAIGIPFLTQPRLVVRNAGGDPLAGVQIVAELVQVTGVGGPFPRVLLPFSNQTDFALAMVVEAANALAAALAPAVAAPTPSPFLAPSFAGSDDASTSADAPAVGRPVSSPTDALGAASFTALTILGAAIGTNGTRAPVNTYRLRFTVCPGVFVESTTVIDPSAASTTSTASAAAIAAASRFAGTTATVLAQTASSANVSTVVAQLTSTLPFFAVPGRVMKDILVLVVRPPLLPVLGARVLVAVESTGILLRGSQLGAGFAAPGVVRLSGLAFPESTPDGAYRLAIIYPGCGGAGVVKTTTSITVTRSPFAIDIVVPPPVNFLVGLAFPAVVFVRIADGSALPGAVVSLEMTGSTVPSSCAAGVCGSLEASSKQALTNASGFARFSVLVRAAQPGVRFTFRFSVVGGGSSLIEKLNGAVGTVMQSASLASSAASTALHFANSVPVSGTAALSSGVQVVEGQELLPALVAADVRSAQRSASFAALDCAGLAAAGTSALYRSMSAASEIAAKSETPSLSWSSIGVVRIVRHSVGKLFLTIASSSEQLRVEAQPIVRVLDHSGRPLQGRSVVPVVYAGDGSETSVAAVWEADAVTSADGTYEFRDLRLRGAFAGTYFFVFVVDGTSSNSSAHFQIADKLDVTEQQRVEIVAAVVIVLLLPAFFASMPHSNYLFYVGSCAVIVGLVALSTAWVATNVVANENKFLRLHIGMIGGILTLMLLFQVGIAVTWFVGRTHWIFRIFDDESRANNSYRYAVWLINARRPQRTAREWQRIEEETERKTNVVNRVLRTVNNEEISARIETIRSRIVHAGHSEQQSIYGEMKGYEPPPLVCPDDVTWIFFPQRVFVVFAITVVLVLTAIYYVVWISERLQQQLDTLAGLVPAPPELSPSERSSVNKELQSAIVFSLNMLAESFPQLAFLRSAEPYLRKMDIFSLWATVHVVVNELKVVVSRSSSIALACGVLSTVATWIGMHFATIRIITEIRRGERRWMKPSTSLILADKYVGLHVMHFVFGFLIVSAIVFIVCVLLQARSVLNLIGLDVWLAILTSLVSVIAMALFEALVVNRFWVNQLTIKLTHPYLAWSMAALVVSLVNGVAHTLGRWVKAIFSITVLFARLDMDMFPEALMFIDTGYWSFYSCLFVHEEYTNPIFLSCAAVFVTDMMLIRELHAGVQTPYEEFGSHCVTLPTLRNLVRIRLRHLTGNPLSLSEPCLQRHYPWGLVRDDAVTRKRRRAFTRWRLIVLLILNPSLVRYRKHRQKIPDALAEQLADLAPAERRAAMMKKRASLVAHQASPARSDPPDAFPTTLVSTTKEGFQGKRKLGEDPNRPRSFRRDSSNVLSPHNEGDVQVSSVGSIGDQ